MGVLPPEEGDRCRWHPSSARPRCNPQAKSPGGEGFPLGLVRAASRKPRNHPSRRTHHGPEAQPRAARRRDHRRERDRQEPELRNLPLRDPGTRCRGARPQVHRRREGGPGPDPGDHRRGGRRLPYGRLLGARGRDPGPVRGQGPGALRRRAPGIPRARGRRPPHQAGGPRGRELPTPRSAADGLGGHGRRARRGGGRASGSPCGGAGGKTARAFPSLPRLLKKGWFEIGQPAGGGPSPAAPSTRKGSGAARP